MNNDFITKDFWLAAYLLATDNKLKSYTKSDGITRFIFDVSERINDLVTHFYTQTATVNVAAFCYAQRTLKGIIYDGCINENKNYVKQSKENN